ncbi:putative short chain dehydrogenase reductase [Phaeomoniella chlamydospora]|uniref:Short-chain dehydrogenase/reductase 3 n=1 Tax=Phaeomoniella chlamydospora TaxID=158046 RepID=A0A0G2GPH2_PHACM|nr:putative short chain dehydrogenase reductase [Phaeomoniella chlamydospora]
MPFHTGWLPREGFTGDVLGGWIKQSILNPALTIPLLLGVLLTPLGQTFTKSHESAVGQLKYLATFGVVRVLNGYLNRRAVNNGVSDRFDWADGELVVCTGGADGIGKQIVLLLAELGVKVAVLDIRPPTYEAPKDVRSYQCDIRSTSSIAQAAAQIRLDFGRDPTVLINNAGLFQGKTVLDSSEADLRAVFDVNTLAHYWLAKEFLPSMVAQNHGMIVTVASLAGYVPTANMIDYSSSKAAAITFHEGLAAELVTRYKAPRVRTVLVTQGYTKTPLFAGWQPKAEFLSTSLEPETVAEETVRFILSGNSGQLILPGFFKFSALGMRILPDWIAVRARNFSASHITEKFRGRTGVVESKQAKQEKREE